jgi:hypothetical protein
VALNTTNCPAVSSSFKVRDLNSSPSMAHDVRRQRYKLTWGQTDRGANYFALKAKRAGGEAVGLGHGS